MDSFEGVGGAFDFLFFVYLLFIKDNETFVWCS